MTNTNDSTVFKKIFLEDNDRYFFPVSAPKKRGFKLSD
jgi:hypothetical protein